MSSTTDTVDKQSLGQALGRLGSGVYILTLEHDNKPEGMMVTWISQCSFEPPMVTLAVNKERPILKNITIGTKFTVNVLSGDNKDIFKAFARPATSAEERFDGLAVDRPRQNGGPVLTDAVAYLDCVAKQQVDASDHMVIVAEVTQGSLMHSEKEPMIHLRKNGFQY